MSGAPPAPACRNECAPRRLLLHDATRHGQVVAAGAVQGMPSPTAKYVLSGDATESTFQTETREFLDIVANSLYTDLSLVY
jgi:hypothetical protein